MARSTPPGQGNFEPRWPRLVSALLTKLAVVRNPGWDRAEWLSSSLFALTLPYFPLLLLLIYASVFLAVLPLHPVSHLCLSVTSFGLPLIPDVLPKEIC